MRLKQIKLAGFKSFVDPTIFSLEPQLIGIVGPNGCGKSNIIDAVRWVLGESSAKDLRGESMLDVIFNGSNARKPVGRAAVELLFDNSEGKLSREYANFTEIAIRREMDRERQSEYYLNDKKCRKRDITDLFAGTGLLQNGYAIISQGTVSQIIESKPEDLRLFIEEAADISIYKKRRHETELRMSHTEENLLRLQDLEQEQERLMNKLEKQAAAATKYQEYNQQKHQIELEIIIIKAKKFNNELDRYNQDLAELSLQLEQLITQKTKIGSDLEQQKFLQIEQTELVAANNQQYYQITTEISKLEQILQHKQEQGLKLQQELDSGLQELTRIRVEYTKEQQLVKDLTSQLEVIAQTYANSANNKEVAEKIYLTAQTELHQTQDLGNQVQLKLQHENHLANQYRNSLEQIENLSKELTFRIEKLQQEKIGYDQQGLAREILILEQDLATAKQELNTKQLALNVVGEQIEPQKKLIKNLLSKKNLLQTDLYELQGSIGSLQALQNAALECNDFKNNWLNNYNIKQDGLFFDNLRIEDGWEVAVAVVLNQYLDGILLNDKIENFPINILEAVKDFRVTLIESKENSQDYDQFSQQPNSKGLVSIASKVATNYLNVWLKHVYVAENLNAALANRTNLLPYEYLVTKNGELVGADWLIIDKIDNKQKILLRNKQLKNLQQQFKQVELDLATVNSQLTEAEQQLGILEQQQKELGLPIVQQEEIIRKLIAKLSAKQSQLHTIEHRIDKIELEVKEYQEKILLLIGKTNDLRANLAGSIEQIAVLTQEFNDLSSKKLELQTNVAPLLAEHQAAIKTFHEGILQQQQLSIKLQNAQDTVEKLANQIQYLSNYQDKLKLEFKDYQLALPPLQAQLQSLLEHQVSRENSLSNSQDELNLILNNINILEKQLGDLTKTIDQLKEQLNQTKLNQQASTIHLNELISLAKHNNEVNLSELLADSICTNIENSTNLPELQAKLDNLNKNIQKLGAVNLAAVEELHLESERYHCLKSQLQDLTKALDTLKDAIAKIDIETTKKFKNTFEQINHNFQKLFPQLFGGGSAYLSLSAQDLLESGVCVLAQPPGKKNSSIYLLSGGEKALTAVALIFAIFQLNPAPFCILDEVDAPLDDANVIRFSELIRSMSAKVQFMFITHNKITMKIANQLIGVTMKEPGVSRLVSVNMDEAVALID